MLSINKKSIKERIKDKEFKKNILFFIAQNEKIPLILNKTEEIKFISYEKNNIKTSEDEEREILKELCEHIPNLRIKILVDLYDYEEKANLFIEHRLKQVKEQEKKPKSSRLEI